MAEFVTVEEPFGRVYVYYFEEVKPTPIDYIKILKETIK